MPTPDGTMTPQELETAHQKLHEFWTLGGGKKPCPQCGEVAYWIMPQIISNRSDAATVLSPHFRYPAVAIVCQRCGYMDQYLSRNLGVEWQVYPAEGGGNG